MISRYENLYKASLENTEKFWDEAAKDVIWFKPYKKILDRSNPPFYRWFPDGVINSCYNAIDRHVEEGNGSRTAILYDSPVTSKKKSFSYLEAKKIKNTYMIENIDNSDSDFEAELDEVSESELEDLE